MSNTEKQTIVTPVGRLVFSKNLFKSFTTSKGAIRWKAAMVIDDKKDVKAIQKILMDAAKGKWGDKLPNGLKMGMKKEVREDFLASYPFLKDAFIINAANGFEIPVIDLNNEEKFDGDIKDGDQVRFNLSAYAFENPENRGVSLNLLGVQFIREDKAFYSRASAVDMFASAESIAAPEPSETTPTQDAPAAETAGEDYW